MAEPYSKKVLDAAFADAKKFTGAEVSNETYMLTVLFKTMVALYYQQEELHKLLIAALDRLEQK